MKNLLPMLFIVITSILTGCSSPDEKQHTPEERAELEHAAKIKNDFECEQAEIETRIMNLNGFVNLYTALKFGLVAPVNAEIDRQGTANIMLETPYERTALYEACRYGADQMVELLLSRGADPSIRSGGELPINVAWSRIYSDKAREEINAGKLTVDENGDPVPAKPNLPFPKNLGEFSYIKNIPK